MSDVATALLQLIGRAEPAADPALAAVKLARASLDALILRLGQTIDAKVTAQLAGGLTQLTSGGETFVLKLETPLPVNTAVTLKITPTPTGQPAVTVTVPPQPPAAQPAPPAPPAVQPLPQPTTATPATPATPVPPPIAQPIATTPPPSSPQPAAPTPAPPTAPPVATATRVPVQPQVQPSTVATQTPTPPAPHPATSPPAPAATAQPAAHPSPVLATPIPTGQPVPTSPAPAATAATSTPLPTPPATTPNAPPPPAPATALAQPAPTSAAASVPTPSVPATPSPVTANPTPPPSPVPQPAVTGTPASVPVAPTPLAPTTAPQPAPAAAPTSPAPQPATAATLPPPLTPIAQPPTPVAAPPVARPATPPPASPPLTQILADPVQAAARQDSVLPLIARLATLAAPTAAALPRPALEAIAMLLSTRLDLNRAPPDGKAIREAVLRAGVITEPGTRTPADAKSALLQLRSTLSGFLGGEVEAIAPVTRRPPPPLKGEPVRAPSAQPASPLPDEPVETARQLLGHADAALSRTKLLQLASNPADAARPNIAAPAAEFRVEVPMQLGAETGILQLLVERDGKHKRTPAERGWRMRFALNFTATGEVGAEIALLGRAANVALWAADPATADALEAMLPELAPALARHGLDVGAVRVRRGAPQPVARAPGQLLDSAR